MLWPSVHKKTANVRQLWLALKINDFRETIALDLKLANIMVDIMAHVSQFLCTRCDADKENINERGELRTVGENLKNISDWQVAGSKKTQAKKYKICIYPPVFTYQYQYFLDIIPPPELHLILSVVNTIFTHLMKEHEDIALRWTKVCNVQHQFIRGSAGFSDTACKLLLNK